jgi:putative SbcD/Mre11-related phosphoesterase
MKIEYKGKCLLIEESGKRVLVMGDLHLGYEGSMRRSGVMIPIKLYDKCVKNFMEVIENTKRVDKIVVLGDLKHEFGYILHEEWENITDFLKLLKEYCEELVIIEGNHDPILFPVLKKIGAVGVEHYIWKEFIFTHGDKDFPELYDKKIRFWVLGHGHPAINLTDGVKRENYKCFLAGEFKKKKVILVPSFFPLIMGTDARDFDLGYPFDFKLEKFKVIIVEDNLNSLKFGKLRNI